MVAKNSFARLVGCSFALSSASWVLVVGLMSTFSNHTSNLAGPTVVLLLKSIPSLIVALWAGAVIDRSQKKQLLSGALVLLALASAMIAVSLSIWTLVAATFLIALAEAFAFPSLQSLIPGLASDPERLLKANTLVVGADMAAMVAGPLVGFWALKHFNPAVTFAAAAGFALVSLLMARLLPKSDLPAVATSDKPSAPSFVMESLIGFRLVLREGELIRYSLLALLAFIGTGLLGAVELPFCTEILGLSNENYGMFVAISGLGSIVVTWISQRYELDASKSFLATLLLQGVTYAGYGLQSELWKTFPFVFLIGVNECLYRSSYRALLQKRVQSHQLGLVSAFNFVIERLALVFGVMIGGLSMQYFPPNYALLIFGLVLTVASVQQVWASRKSEVQHASL